ncbi:MAG: IS200/IS605 family transposase [Muribaculaceae bacterium]|nr:IS200/IS605 family transposase [Muribaculaceae bacterium]MDE6609867.1 IS200/IS605 family transposase [Muribaculaceae bacterium]
MSYIRHYFHIVFSPKGRNSVIQLNAEAEIYSMITSLIMKYKGYVYAINGMADHIHLLVSLPTTVTHSEIIRVAKQESSKYIRDRRIIPFWEGWQEGYASFTCGFRELSSVRKYIENQKEHHRHRSFIDEYKTWLIENGISPDDPYFPKV